MLNWLPDFHKISPNHEPTPPNSKWPLTSANYTTIFNHICSQFGEVYTLNQSLKNNQKLYTF